MKKILKKPKNILGIVFLFIIAFFMLAILGRFLGAKFLHINFDDTSATEQAANEENTSSQNWELIYPFSEKYTMNISNSTSSSTEPTENKSKYLEAVNLLENRINYYSTNLLFGRMKFVEYNALFNKYIGMEIVTGTDSVIIMNNGYLTFSSIKLNTENTAKSLKWFSDILAENNINFIYVQYPSKESIDNNQLPFGVNDYNNQNADNLLKNLSNEKVKAVDMRPLLCRAATDYYSCFFKTDHHWKPETGVWAAGELAKVLNTEFNYGIDDSIGDISKYTVKVYHDYCFGSEGKKVTLKFAEPEDISLIYPKADTKFTAQYNSKNTLSGTFLDTMINTSVFDKIDYYNISTYAAYLYGNNALVSIHNELNQSGKRILLIGDSFNACVIPYLAQDVEYIDKIDLRYFNGSTMSYIEATKPDTVIVAYNNSMISSDISRGSLYNFE